jgi:7,8-dihydropterin-6-yl-methyl-4-(beta-D-ribofuranosyl)aminobenzene 5'-phosphate synthase
LSYLIKTDRSSVLLDLGYNKQKEDPSPLAVNAGILGIDLGGVDAVALSHPHPDHAGGVEILFRKAAWSTASHAAVKFPRGVAPSAVTIDGATAEVFDEPGLVTSEVGTTGTLMAQTFFTGKVPEESLLVNLRGKGLVVISGCGHPGIVEIAKTAQRITGIPLYALVGGFHLYYGQGNGGIMPAIFGGTRFLAWPETRSSVATKVKTLRALGVKKVYLSPHDSNPQTARLFAEVFGNSFHKVVTGEPVSITAE